MIQLQHKKLVASAAIGIFALAALFYGGISRTPFVQPVHAQTSTVQVSTDRPSVAESTKETPSQESKNEVGGHEDPAGQNVDHQFEGVE